MTAIDRRTFIGLMGALAASGMLTLSGCGTSSSKQTTTEDGKQIVTVGLWANQLLETYAPWLQEQFPDVMFDFHAIKNSTDFYRFRAEKDALPDILTVRRFSLRDVEQLKDQLVDLSDSDLANSFYQAYLRSYTYSDGTVNWLPACAEIDDIIVNKTLFEQHNIPLPTDYASFTGACEEFAKLGIVGYRTDFASDYTCMETLQGLSAAQLSSAEGRQWRQDYESGTTNRLTEEVWLPVFQKFVDFAGVVGINADSLEQGMFTDVFPPFDKGTLAMYRGTVTNMEAWGNDYEREMYPYPADSESDNFFLTYPVFQAAASAAGSDTDDRAALVGQILTAMFTEEGLNNILPGQTMVAYNKDVEMELSDQLNLVRDYAEANRMYIRLASADMFSCSQEVVAAFLKGEVTTAQGMFDKFNELLEANENAETPPTVAHIDKGYSRLFTSEHGNQAASAIMNTLREELGVDFLIGQSAACCGDIPEGDLTEAEAGYLTRWESAEARKMTLTGEQLAQWVEFCLTVKGTRDSVVNDYTLPVSSGFEMDIRKEDGEYHLNKLTVNGEDLDSSKEYTVVSWDGLSKNYTDVLEQSGFTEYETVADDAEVEQYVIKRLVEEGGQLADPTDYITLS